MYAKLFSRITESSLMEEPLPIRYVFVMLLAISDAKGYVIGTDIALARRLNIPLADFQAAIARLSAPDPVSNSPEEEGRRILPSDGERGYRLVNYTKYSALRDEGHRRDYMRGYMAEYRAGGKGKSDACKQPVNTVNSSKQGKPQLANVDVDVDVEANKDVGQIDLVLQGEARSAEASPAPKQPVSDADWLAELQADPAYTGMDVQREYAKMVRWCSVKRKRPSRLRLINWLNRAEQPMTATARPEPNHDEGF